MPQPVATLIRVAESLRDRNPRRRHLENEAAASASRAQYGEPLMRLPASPQACLDLRGEEEKQLGAFFSEEQEAEAEVEEREDGRRRSLQPDATLSSASSVSAMTTPRHQPGDDIYGLLPCGYPDCLCQRDARNAFVGTSASLGNGVSGGGGI